MQHSDYLAYIVRELIFDRSLKVLSFGIGIGLVSNHRRSLKHLLTFSFKNFTSIFHEKSISSYNFRRRELELGSNQSLKGCSQSCCAGILS